jgi:hypothetical protein
VVGHWPSLSADDRDALKRLLNADEPEDVVAQVLGLIGFVGARNVASFEPASLEFRRDRLRTQAARHNEYLDGRGIREVPADLPHLEPATADDYEFLGEDVELFGHGAAVFRERHTANRGRRRNVVFRPFDDRKTALSSSGTTGFNLSSLRRFLKRVERFGAELEELRQTPLARQVIAQDPLMDLAGALRGLQRLRELVLPSLITEAEAITVRDRRDTRPLVIQILQALKIATRSTQTRLVCDLLNWRAPLGRNKKWSSSTLRRWAAAAGPSEIAGDQRPVDPVEGEIRPIRAIDANLLVLNGINALAIALSHAARVPKKFLR